MAPGSQVGAALWPQALSPHRVTVMGFVPATEPLFLEVIPICHDLIHPPQQNLELHHYITTAATFFFN